MYEEKKKYLSQYLLQTAKIYRLQITAEQNPADGKRCAMEIKNAEKLRKNIEKKISRVDGGILSELLFLKYVCGKSLFEISFCLNYSKRHTERLHLKALRLFEI